MCTVYYKKSGKTVYYNNNTTQVPESNIWIIQKKFRLNPATNRDHPYTPDFYKREILTGAMTTHRCVNLADPVAVAQRAIQVMLHQQTNYDDLVEAGLYRQPPEVVARCLQGWYDLISRKFPAYAQVCQRELERHLTKMCEQRLTKKS